jgi:hypothetical protein
VRDEDEDELEAKIARVFEAGIPVRNYSYCPFGVYAMEPPETESGDGE